MRPWSPADAGSERRIDAVLSLVLAFGVLAAGTVHLATLVILAGLALALAGMALAGRPAATPVRLGWLGAVLLASLLFGFFQLVPLPPGLLARASPAGAALHQLAGSQAGAAHPIALEPAAAAVSLLRRCTAFLVFLVACTVYGSRSSRHVPFAQIVLLGGFMVLVGLAHRALGAHSVWGLVGSYKLNVMNVTTTFVNPNHGAAYLTLAAPLAVGLAVAASRMSWRIVYAGAAVLATGGVLLTGSRGGILGLAGALLFVAAALAARGLRSANRRHRVTALVGIVAAIAAVAATLTVEPVRDRLASLDSSAKLGADLKVRVQKDSLALIDDYARAGAGPGQFATLYFGYRSIDDPRTFTHVENEYLQALADGGVVFGALPVLAMVLAVALAAWRRRSERLVVYELAALLGFAAHAVADFSLETGGVAVAFMAVVGAFVGRPPDGATPRSSSWARSPLLVGMGAAVAALVVALVAAPGSLARDTERARALPARALAADAAAREVEAMVARHPADYVIPLIAAESFAARRPPDMRQALRWLNRSLTLAPSVAAPHLTAARLLRRVGAAPQIVGELALAYRASPDSERGSIIAEAWSLRHDADDVIHTAGTEIADLDRAAAFLEGSRADDAMRVVAEHVLGMAPAHGPSLERLGRLALRHQRFSEAHALASRVLKLDPRSVSAHLIEAGALSAEGHGGAARELVRRALAADPNETRYIFWLIDVALAGADFAEVHRLAETVFLAAPNDKVERARAHALSAQAYEREESPSKAVEEYQRASNLDPGWTSALECAQERLRSR